MHGADTKAVDPAVRGAALTASPASADGQMRTWTIGAVLAAAEQHVEQRGSGPSRAETALALADLLGVDRVQLLLDHERPLSDAERGEFRARFERLLAGEPLAYVRGLREFYGRDFVVDRRVLIPRPETELLVDEAKARLPEDARVFEPCTGSGCVAISLVLERPDLRVTASDVEEGALEVARANVERLLLAAASPDAPGPEAQARQDESATARPETTRAEEQRLGLASGSYWQAVAGQRFDALIANPPYVDPDQPELLEPSVRDWEPGAALFTPKGDPLAAYRELLKGGVEGLTGGALVLFEIGVDQGPGLVDMIERSRGYESPELIEDLAGIPRVLCCRRRAEAAAQ